MSGFLIGLLLGGIAVAVLGVRWHRDRVARVEAERQAAADRTELLRLRLEFDDYRDRAEQYARETRMDLMQARADRAHCKEWDPNYLVDRMWDRSEAFGRTSDPDAATPPLGRRLPPGPSAGDPGGDDDQAG